MNSTCPWCLKRIVPDQPLERVGNFNYHEWCSKDLHDDLEKIRATHDRGKGESHE
jgi:hypothetical protein